MLDWITISCPYCGESYEVAVDCSAGNSQYVEDCQVCCQPILMTLTVNADGELQQFECRQENS